MATLPQKADGPGQVSSLTGTPQRTVRIWDLPLPYYQYDLSRRLQSLVEVNGFYLENDPCIVCNNPEIPFTVILYLILYPV